MKTIKKALPLLCVLLWALLLAPFFLGAGATHPATDDFTFAVYTHPTWVQTGSVLHVLKDAVSYALRTWRDWQGTVTGVLIMALNPAVFSIEHYGAHVFVLLGLILLGTGAFLRHFLKNRLGLPWRAAFLALSAVQLMFLPDIVEGVFWFNGAWFYMGAQAVALMALALGDSLSERPVRGAKTLLGFALCWALLFALGMDNYITAMMTAAALLMLALWRLAAREKGAALRTALLLVPIGAGLLLSVIAPGNSVRMATDGAHESGLAYLLASVGWTLRDAVKYIVRFMLKTPLLALLLLALPTASRRLNTHGETGARMPKAGFVLAGGYLMHCAMIIPHMYSSGYAGSGRVINMYHSYVVLFMPIVLAMVLMRVKPERRARLAAGRGQAACYALSALAFAVCLLGGQLGNYEKLVSDQLDGTQDAYIAQFEREYALCEAAGAEDDVILPAWTVQTVTGKPTAYEDAQMWTNESMAQYFGVKSVRVGEDGGDAGALPQTPEGN